MAESPPTFGFSSVEHLIKMAMSLWHGLELPTRAQVSEHVDGLLALPMAMHFRGQRDYIIDELLRRADVTISAAQVLEDDESHEPWIHDADRDEWRLWQRLRSYLHEEDGIPGRVIDELDSSTDLTLAMLESPLREGTWDRRGMVVGHVQSGKTTHYSALAAKALDAGYRIVIVLAGMHNNLRSQTQSRMDEYLIGRDSRAVNNENGQWVPVGINNGRMRRVLGPLNVGFAIQTATTADDGGDFRVQQAQSVFMHVGDSTRLVMIVKKNATVLRRLRDWFRQAGNASDGWQRSIPHPILVVDDEADLASMNTRDETDDPSTINRLIRELLLSFQRVGFVAYTATPFANVFADPAVNAADADWYGPDLFPSSFIVSLKAPSNYIGPDKVFGSPGDEAEGLERREPLPMYCEVRDADDWLPSNHGRDHRPGALPPTLREAVRLFMLNCAARCARGDSNVHNSMLVHGTRFVLVQARIKEQIAEEVAALTATIRSAAEATRSAIFSELEELWTREIASKHDEFRDRLGSLVDQLPQWSAVAEHILEVCAPDRIAVMEINGTSDDSLAYQNHRARGFWVIAIGGDKLSRGLTLEGLSVSYFLRASRTFDTLMQMGRWFGYRPRYADLCRVYTTADLVRGFRRIALATEELRRDFDRMAIAGRRPSDFGLRVRTPSDGLLITAANKIRRGFPVQVRFDGELLQALRVPRQGPAAEGNRELLNDFVATLGIPERQVRGRPKPWFLWHGVPVSEILDYLERYNASRTHAFLNGCDRLREYIGMQFDAFGDLREWTVCMMSLGGGEGLVEIGGHNVAPVTRSRTDEDCDSSEYDMGAVAWKEEESADLSEAEFERLPERFSRAEIREVRPGYRGLLLLYPVVGDDMDPRDYLVSTVVSLPCSPRAEPLTYTVNEIWRRQELAFLRDDQDDA